MKKTLLASTAALSLVAFAGAASAQVEVSIGGFYEVEFGAASNDQDLDSNGDALAAGRDAEEFGFRTDAEIHFDIRGTTDNGLNFGAEVEMEASDQNEGDLDESWLFVSGDNWGEIRLGFTDGAATDGNIAAPAVTPIGINDGTQGDFIIRPNAVEDVLDGNNAAFDTGISSPGGDDDALKIIYYTPRFFGVQFGLSYAPDPQNGDDNSDFVSDRDGDYKNGIEVALNYVGSFESVDILAGFTYSYAEAGDNVTAGTPAADDFNAIHFGLELGYGGFTFGGGYANILDGGFSDSDSTTTDVEIVSVPGTVVTVPITTTTTEQFSAESWGFDVGASYGQGPWEVSATYFYGEADGLVGATEDIEHQSVLVGGTYQLGAGLQAFAGIGYTEYEGQTAGTDTDDNDGVWGFTGVQISF